MEGRDQNNTDSQTKGTHTPLLDLEALWWAGPLSGLYALEALVIKSVQVLKMAEDLSVADFLGAMAPEFALALSALTVAVLLFSLFSGRLRLVILVPYAGFWAYAFVALSAGFVYFQATGSFLSWSTVKYWASSIGEVNKVVASEATFWRQAMVWGQLVILCGGLVPAFVRRREIGRRLVSTRNALAAYGVTLAILAGLLLAPAPRGAAMMLSRSQAGAILYQLIDEELIPDEEVILTDEERLDGSIELAERKEGPASRMNVVLFVYESLRWKSSDVYVPGLGTTPFLAKLAARGAVIDENYTVVPHTSKALVAIHCGFYPMLVTQPRENTPGILPKRCLAHILRKFGYHTAFFQSAGNFEGRDRLVANMGYEVFRGVDDMPQEGFEMNSYFGREERIMLRPSMEWVDSLEGEPFLLAYLTLSTHHNYVPPQSFPYVDYGVDDNDLNNYMNSIRYIDGFLEDVVDELDKRGLMDNTLLIVVGDHGEAFGEHGRRQHDHVLWEEGIRSAAVYYAPSVFTPGTHIVGPRSVLDIVPTVLDVLGLEVTEGSFVGRSVLTPPDERRLYFACWYRRECLGIREGNVKFIYHYGTRPTEVYDLTTDPEEKINLAYSASFPADLIRKREEEMKRWERMVNQQYEEWGERLKAVAVGTKMPEIAKRLKASFGSQVELLGFDVTPTQVVAGRDVRAKYLFKSVGKLDSGWKLFVHVKHENGKFLNADHVPVGGTHPPNEWVPGQFILDEHIIHVPGNWPPGEARIMVGFYKRGTNQRLVAHSDDAEVDDNRIVVTKVKIQQPRVFSGMSPQERRDKISAWVSSINPNLPIVMDVTFADRVKLVGVNLVQMKARQSGTIEMWYAFEVLDVVPSSWRLTVRLVRDDGVTINGDHVPIGGLYPPGDWRRGEFVVDRHRLLIEYPKHKPGTYKVFLGFQSGSTPVPAKGSARFVRDQRVYLGDVTVEEFKP